MRSCPAGHGSVGVEGFSGSMSWLLGVILEFFCDQRVDEFLPPPFWEQQWREEDAAIIPMRSVGARGGTGCVHGGSWRCECPSCAGPQEKVSRPW